MKIDIFDNLINSLIVLNTTVLKTPLFTIKKHFLQQLYSYIMPINFR